MAPIDTADVIDLPSDQIQILAHEQKALGNRFANIHAVRVENGFQLYYTYVKRQGHAQNYRFFIADGEKVPSISPIFISAFFFENETHDLFGVPFEGIVVDYGGTFYQVALDYPMNPDYKDGAPKVMNDNFTAYEASDIEKTKQQLAAEQKVVKSETSSEDLEKPKPAGEEG